MDRTIGPDIRTGHVSQDNRPGQKDKQAGHDSVRVKSDRTEGRDSMTGNYERTIIQDNRTVTPHT